MTLREWVVPVVLGLVAAGLTYAFVPEDPRLPRASGESTGRPEGPYVLMPSPGVADHSTTLLAFDDAPDHGLGGLLTIHAGGVEDGVLHADEMTWLCMRAPGAVDCGSEGARASGPNGTTPAGIDVGAPQPLPDIRIGADRLTSEITFLAFTGSGHLLASNAPLDVRERYDLHGDFSLFSQTTWYFGEGDAPPGASKVPLHRDLVRDALDGTPVGGVQSIVLEEHEYDWLVGPVWVTARVDAVRDA